MLRLQGSAILALWLVRSLCNTGPNYGKYLLKICLCRYMPKCVFAIRFYFLRELTQPAFENARTSQWNFVRKWKERFQLNIFQTFLHHHVHRDLLGERTLLLHTLFIHCACSLIQWLAIFNETIKVPIAVATDTQSTKVCACVYRSPPRMLVVISDHSTSVESSCHYL